MTKRGTGAREQGGGLPARALLMARTTVLAERRPVDVRRLSGGSFLYTFDRNFVGSVRLAPLPSAVEHRAARRPSDASGVLALYSRGHSADGDGADAERSRLNSANAAASRAAISLLIA